jgi:hypothetical protein
MIVLCSNASSAPCPSSGKLAKKYCNIEILTNTTQTNFFTKIVIFKLNFLGSWTRANSIKMINKENIFLNEFTVNHNIDNFNEMCGPDKLTSLRIKIIFKISNFTSKLILSTISDNLSFSVTDLKIEDIICPENSESIAQVQSSCKCKAGFFTEAGIDGFQCSACPAFCKSCVGPSQGECSECKLEFERVDGLCILKDSKIEYKFNYSRFNFKLKIKSNSRANKYP